MHIVNTTDQILFCYREISVFLTPIYPFLKVFIKFKILSVCPRDFSATAKRTLSIPTFLNIGYVIRAINYTLSYT